MTKPVPAERFIEENFLIDSRREVCYFMSELINVIPSSHDTMVMCDEDSIKLTVIDYSTSIEIYTYDNVISGLEISALTFHSYDLFMRIPTRTVYVDMEGVDAATRVKRLIIAHIVKNNNINLSALKNELA